MCPLMFFCVEPTVLPNITPPNNERLTKSKLQCCPGAFIQGIQAILNQTNALTKGLAKGQAAYNQTQTKHVTIKATYFSTEPPSPTVATPVVGALHGVGVHGCVRHKRRQAHIDPIIETHPQSLPRPQWNQGMLQVSGTANQWFFSEALSSAC